MSFKTTLISFTFSAMLATSAFAASDNNLSAAEAITAAESAQKAAGKVGYEWRDTAKMIEQAKKLASEGKSAEAINLAKKAQEEGQDALAQYQSESSRYARMK